MKSYTAVLLMGDPYEGYYVIEPTTFLANNDTDAEQKAMALVREVQSFSMVGCGGIFEGMPIGDQERQRRLVELNNEQRRYRAYGSIKGR